MNYRQSSKEALESINSSQVLIKNSLSSKVPTPNENSTSALTQVTKRVVYRNEGGRNTDGIYLGSCREK